MTDLDQAEWQPWIDEVCAALGVAAEGVDVARIHRLTRSIASGFVRPMAPVAAYLWGLAIATSPDADPEVLSQTILAAMPKDTAEQEH